MDRVVKRLCGKLYMGPALVPHYYVQFKDSEDLVFVRCAEVDMSNAQKVAFDVNFEHDERRNRYSGPDVREKNAKKQRTSNTLSALNFIADENDERAPGDRTALQDNKIAPPPHTPVVVHDEDDDVYEASFIQDSTPTVHSSSDSDTPCASKSVIQAKKKRKRAVLNQTKKARKRVVFDSDDDLSSEPSPNKHLSLEARKQVKKDFTWEKAVTPIAADQTGSSRKKSTAPSKYTPLIILGANGNAVAKNSNASSPDIPVITID